MNRKRIAVWTFFSIFCAAMAADSIRIASAEAIAGSSAPEPVRRAIQIWPHRADYYRYLAVLEPDSSAHWFAEALARNPRDTRSWLRMGLQAEADGKLADAERYLVEATHLDRTYEPRWNLSNFYFRKGDHQQFWRWARDAAAVSREDLTPVFDLAWQVRPETQAMLNEIVPADCASRRRFFAYLRNAGATQAGEVAPRLLACTDAESRGLLTQYANALIFSGEPDEALGIWNELIARRRLPFRRIDPAAGDILSNPEFSPFPTRLGFDWHFDPVRGVVVTALPERKGLRLTFDGMEADALPVLYQPVLVRPGASYKLSFESGNLPEGFRWRLADLRSGAPVIADSEDLAGQPGRRQWIFRTANVPVHVLALIYQRPQGNTRFSGSIDLHRVDLTPAESPR